MKVNYVVGEDWQGLYIANKLEVEGHTLSIMEVLDICSFKLDESKDDKFSVAKYEVNQDWLENRGSFPDDFEEIPKDMLEFDTDVSF